LGEDGPTHQPIEQLAGLRAIPHLHVIRPADSHEVREAWRLAIRRRKGPTVLALTRQKVAVIDRTKFGAAEGTRRGGYILADAVDAAGQAVTPKLILLATGSEVGLALTARESLQTEGIPTRIVSMPCFELFDEQDATYRDQVLPNTVTARLAIEAGVRQGWDHYIGPAGDMIGLDRFGASAPGEVVLRELGFSVENVLRHARALL
ncbi:MAG: transketolase C-terminal domain-containing protein, partial [Pyrinomonadaceae bacterium]